MAYITENEADIRVFVADENGAEKEVGDGNSWATYAGGGLSAKGSKTRPAGMDRTKGEVALGGPASRADATVTIQNSDTMVGLNPWLESRVGKAKARIQIHYLDSEGNTIPGAQHNVTGKLKEAMLPGQNYESSNVGMYTIVVETDEKSA